MELKKMVCELVIAEQSETECILFPLHSLSSLINISSEFGGSSDMIISGERLSFGGTSVTTCWLLWDLLYSGLVLDCYLVNCCKIMQYSYSVFRLVTLVPIFHFTDGLLYCVVFFAILVILCYSLAFI